MNVTLPPRVMIAKPGLDGHDRGAVVIVQALRDAGFDVIYTGLRRTPAQIAVAAAQEDVDVLGVSCMSGAHLALLESIVRELDALRWRPSLLMAGGIIPAHDLGPIQAMGYPVVLGPGTPTQAIRETILAHVPRRTVRDASDAPAWVQASRQLTELELGASSHESGGTNRGRIILVAGQGGAGKSTLIGGLIGAAMRRNVNLAVLANDPVSVTCDGSILADRLRMPMDADPQRVLIRSIPVRGGGSIAPACAPMAQRLALQCDLVLVETIGIAQNEPAAPNWCDRTLAVVAPGTGDHWQLRKHSLLETCQVIALTKSDLPEAQRLRGELEQVLHDLRPAQSPMIVNTSASDPASMDALLGYLLT